ncbi:MAG: hypothetical protein ACETWK_14190 [Candidatus Aminicenantaceae bacterium]
MMTKDQEKSEEQIKKEDAMKKVAWLPDIKLIARHNDDYNIYLLFNN